MSVIQSKAYRVYYTNIPSLIYIYTDSYVNSIAQMKSVILFVFFSRHSFSFCFRPKSNCGISPCICIICRHINLQSSIVYLYIAFLYWWDRLFEINLSYGNQNQQYNLLYSLVSCWQHGKGGEKRGKGKKWGGKKDLHNCGQKVTTPSLGSKPITGWGSLLVWWESKKQ